MVQIKILSGRKAGMMCSLRNFPARIGRSAASNLQLEEPGVWDGHCLIALEPGAGFFLETESDALVTVNSQPTRRTALRNGDTLELGSAKIQFWLSEPCQRGLSFQEMSVWSLIAAICAGQLGLIWLLQTCK